VTIINVGNPKQDAKQNVSRVTAPALLHNKEEANSSGKPTLSPIPARNDGDMTCEDDALRITGKSPAAIAKAIHIHTGETKHVEEQLTNIEFSAAAGGVAASDGGKAIKQHESDSSASIKGTQFNVEEKQHSPQHHPSEESIRPHPSTPSVDYTSSTSALTQNIDNSHSNGNQIMKGSPKSSAPFPNNSNSTLSESPSSSPTPTPGEGDQDVPTLALQDVNYRVRYRSGPWWRGACFRHQHVKRVLRDVTLALPAGQLIGLVGSSGECDVKIG
jgi:hypothetical protein